MTISRISSQLVESNTLTPAAHVQGDFFLADCYRLSGTTGISVPSGWLRLTGPTGANSTNRVMACKWALSSAEAFGTWTNAEFVSLRQYRGSSGTVMPGGSPGSAVNATSLVLSFASLNVRQFGGPFWVAASAAINTADTDIEVPSSPLVLSSSILGSGVTGEVATYDTNGDVTSFSAITRTMSGTSGNLCRMHVELLEATVAASGGGSTTHNPFRSRAFGVRS